MPRLMKISVRHTNKESFLSKDFTIGPYKREYHRSLGRLWRRAIEAFILAALEEVHIDTGMSRATFLDLGKKIKVQAAMEARIHGFGPSVKPGHKSLYGAPVPSENIAEFKSASLGFALGSKAYKIDYGKQEKINMQFFFAIVSLQHFYHEFGVKGNPPWHSLKVGKKAFLDYMRENARESVPNLAQYLLNGKIIRGR